MADKKIIIDGVDVSECEFLWKEKLPKKVCNNGNLDCDCSSNLNCIFKQLKRKEQECEELQERTASIIYSLTGGRLSYSTYTLEGCEQAYHDQLEIDVERATKELEEKLQAKEQECEELKEWQIRNQPTGICETCTEKSVEDMYKYKQALKEIGDFLNGACDACKEFTPNRQGDISCRYCQPTQILNIINKVKEK